MIVVQPERQVTVVQSKFYCNIKVLTPAERARHKQLSEKLMAARKEIVETEKGYEFQYSPAGRLGGGTGGLGGGREQVLPVL